MITPEQIKQDKQIKTYIERADDTLQALGYTEHSFAHVTHCAEFAARILAQLGYGEHDQELARIAGFMHDIGNVVNRHDHALSGATMAFRILDKMGMEPPDVAAVITAIGHHDDSTAYPVNAIAAALILADKTDVRRSRVRSKEHQSFDIHDRFNYAWKILMQNHPHDSICGCSVDQVNKEIEVRFDRSTEIAHTLSEDASAYVADLTDTSVFEKYGENAVPFVVFNTTGDERTGKVTVVLDAKRDYNKWLWDGRRDMKAWELPEYVVVDSEGNVQKATVEDADVKFGYDLPDDKFRQPYMARQVKVSLFAEKLPALGYRTYALLPAEAVGTAGKGSNIASDDRHLENEFLKVTINDDSTLNVLDKQTGKTYEGLGYVEDTLDAGNEYIYFCPKGNPAIVTKGTKAEIKLVENTDFAASVEVTNVLTVPVSADDQLKEEQEGLVEFMKRTCGRSSETTQVVLHTTITLEKDSRSVRFVTEFDNTAKDHRIRVVAPTGISCTHHYADSVFEVVNRPNEHSKLWENPCKCEHQQSFVGLNDEKGGMLIANIGLYEYEILPEEKNALAVTILRSVGELGDWGVFPTELSQQLRHITAEYEMTFFAGDLVESNSFRSAYQFQVPYTVAQTKVHAGTLPAEKSWLTWEGERMMFSNLKEKAEGTDRMARFVNCSGEPTVLRIKKDASFETLYFSNILEEEVRPETANADGWYEIPVRGFEIVTVGMR